MWYVVSWSLSVEGLRDHTPSNIWDFSCPAPHLEIESGMPPATAAYREGPDMPAGNTGSCFSLWSWAVGPPSPLSLC